MKTYLMSSLKISHSYMMAMFISLAMVILSPWVSAQVVHRSSDFNHMKTGFPLTGVHINVECETCHAGGIFKGTPTACAGCHSPGRRVVAPFKHSQHIITNEPCEVCHTNSVTFLGARFNHIGVQPRACMTCHNGGMASGKPGGHVVTNAQCDTCHRTSAWLPAGFDHASANVLPNTCSNCHVTGVNGAKQKPYNHIPSPNTCDVCHTLGYISFNGPGASRSTIHGTVSGTPCKDCHSTAVPLYLGINNGDRRAVTHEGALSTEDCNKSGCHSTSGW